MKVLSNVGHDGTFIRTNIADILYIQKRLISVRFGWEGLPEYQSFQQPQKRFQNFGDDYVAGGCCIAINLGDSDQLMRN